MTTYGYLRSSQKSYFLSKPSMHDNTVLEAARLKSISLQRQGHASREAYGRCG